MATWGATGGGGGGGGGASNLQEGYDDSTTPPQIVLNATPDPFTVRGGVAGDLFVLEDSGSTQRLRAGDTTSALLELTSTTQGFRPPVMTEAQRDLIGTPLEGLVVYNTDDGQLNSYNGSSWVIPGAGLTTLSGAYLNSPTGAQIVINSVPDPITIQASVAGTVFELRDLAANPIMTVRADPDQVEIDGQLLIQDAFANAGAANSIQLSDTFTTGAGYVGGGILSNGTVTYNNSVFIWALMQESKVYRAAVGPGFAAFTLFNALARIENSGNFDLVQALTLNVGVTHARTTSGTSAVIQNNGVNFAPRMDTTAVGAILTRTSANLATVSPTFSTTAFSTANLGTIRGIQFIQPGVALFGSSAGVENMTAYYGIDFPDMTFGGASATYSVVRSQLNTGTNKRFLDHTGNASSRMRGHLIFDVDAFGVILGASSDVLMRWSAAGNLSFFGFGTSSDLQISAPAANRFLFNTPGGGTSGEFNINCARASIGDQTGAVGNQVIAMVGGARTLTVGGEFSSVLFTQSGNYTIDANLSVYTMTFNAPSMTAGTGTVTTAAALNVGGNPNLGTNRYGFRCISNPSGGTLNYCARFEGAAGVRIDGLLEHNGTTLGFYGTTPAVQPAAYTPTNVTTDRSYDANSTTLDEVADVLGTLIADLQSVGLLQ